MGYNEQGDITVDLTVLDNVLNSIPFFQNMDHDRKGRLNRMRLR